MFIFSAIKEYQKFAVTGNRTLNLKVRPRPALPRPPTGLRYLNFGDDKPRLEPPKSCDIASPNRDFRVSAITVTTSSGDDNNFRRRQRLEDNFRSASYHSEKIILNQIRTTSLHMNGRHKLTEFQFYVFVHLYFISVFCTPHDIYLVREESRFLIFLFFHQFHLVRAFTRQSVGTNLIQIKSFQDCEA